MSDRAPASYAELRTSFTDDSTCLRLLEELRWPAGFVCPDCGHDAGWRMDAGEQRCAGCRRRVSVTTGTILHGTRTPLRDWFAAAWLLTQSPRGISARELRRRLGLGSYQTAWAMLHRLRATMSAGPQDRLTDRVHLDEVQLGRRTAGVPGRGVLGIQLTAIAVQTTNGVSADRVRVHVLPENSPASIRTFLLGSVIPGSTIVTDGWAAYPPACRRLWTHQLHDLSAPGHGRSPSAAVTHVDTLLNRWLVETHLASVRAEHLQSYLDEFAFRYNHGVTDDRSDPALFVELLRRAVGARPQRYRDIVSRKEPVPRLVSA